MAAFKSDNVTNKDATPLVKIAQDKNNVAIELVDTYTTPASGAPAVGDTVDFGPIPKDARVNRIGLVWEALSSGAGAAGADVGLSSSGDGARYEAALNMDAAGNKEYGLILDKLPESVLTKDEPTYLRLTVTGEAWAVSKKVQARIAYVQ